MLDYSSNQLKGLGTLIAMVESPNGYLVFSVKKKPLKHLDMYK